MNKKIDGNKFEQLTKWYLRFNGYFTVDNFIIHAADDLLRTSNGVAGYYTGIDVLRLRTPFHGEQTGELEVLPDDKLNCIEKIDVGIAECKTGNQNRLESTIGIKSVHDAWDNLINKIFEVSNDLTTTFEHKKGMVYEILK